MTVRVPVRPEMLTWAVERARLSDDTVEQRFPKFEEWLTGARLPTFAQLEGFARAVHAPLGYLFLNEPPDEPLPIPDFRTFGNEGVPRPSPDLLDTIYLCQTRQEWFREHTVAEGADPVSFVGSVDPSTSVTEVADKIRRELRFTVDDRVRVPNWEVAQRQLIDAIEDLGVLVMISGIVGGNTRRALDPREFRGFALADRLAPVIFVTGADTKAAQIFTMVHELAHIGAGQTGLSDVRLSDHVGNASEEWANKVAAEALLPLASLRSEYRGTPDVAELERLSKQFKVSTLVVVKRIFDAGLLAWDEYRARYSTEVERIMEILARRDFGARGGDWRRTQPLRISRTFARAVIVDALEGRTLYRDAYALVGAARHETFANLAAELGVA